MILIRTRRYYHTAAHPAMTISWEDLELDFSTNVIGTFNVLETARRLQIPVAICSSIHTYGLEKINSFLKDKATRCVRRPAVISELKMLGDMHLC